MADANVGEEWRWIPGYEGLYEVSDIGAVRSYNRYKVNNSKPWPHTITPSQNNGYLRVNLAKNKIYKSFGVHRLVLLAFVGKPPTPKHQAAHNNGISADNRLGNLRWATNAENQRDRVLHGTHMRGERHKNSKLTNAQTIEILDLKNAGVTQKDIASRYGVSDTAIYLIFKGINRRSITGLPRLG